MMKLLVEAIIVGVATIVVGFIVSKIVYHLAYIRPAMPYHLHALCWFLVGFSLHLICEFTGVNKWYCKNGFACS